MRQQQGLVKRRRQCLAYPNIKGGGVTELTITGLRKSYTPGRPVLDDVSLNIASGEFFTLLGPSGCGKTTLLRCIAGFLSPDAGQIAAGGIRLDTMPAHRRDIGMVFQDYAIFPHLTVAANVGFGLKARGMAVGSIAPLVADALRMVRLEGFADRLPADMSGGQQQRIGLARAMVIRPRLLLMDEPLSNLDAKLRLELREDIRTLQRSLGITTIYVTHDQEEALAVSDRICVMHAGRIEQVASPFELYRTPATRFAASFVGAMNFLPARIADGVLQCGPLHLPIAAADGTVELAIRPEDLGIGPGPLSLPGIVQSLSFLGREAMLTVATEIGLIQQLAAAPDAELLARVGQPILLNLPAARIAVFAADGRRLPGTLL